MKIKIIFLFAVIVFVVIGVLSYGKVSTLRDKSNFSYILLCDEFSQYPDDSTNWHFVIYLDINACLTCTDHVPSWIELEKQLPKYGGKLLIFTNHQDSLDVAVAMELEGLDSDVHVLNNGQIEQLNLSEKRTPIKILLDPNCEPLLIIEPFNSENKAEQFYDKLLDKIRSFS